MSHRMSGLSICLVCLCPSVCLSYLFECLNKATEGIIRGGVMFGIDICYSVQFEVCLSTVHGLHFLVGVQGELLCMTHSFPCMYFIDRRF